MFSSFTHEGEIESDILKGSYHRSQGLAGDDEMSQIGQGMFPAGGCIGLGVDGIKAGFPLVVADMNDTA